MNLLIIALLGIGIVLIYAAIMDKNPKDVVLKALGAKS